MVGMGADAAEMYQAADAGVLDGLDKIAGEAGNMFMNVEVRVEEIARGLHQIDSVGAFEPGRKEVGVFEGPDGRDSAHCIDIFCFILFAADNRDGMPLTDENFGEGLADVAQGAGENNFHFFGDFDLVKFGGFREAGVVESTDVVAEFECSFMIFPSFT